MAAYVNQTMGGLDANADDDNSGMFANGTRLVQEHVLDPPTEKQQRCSCVLPWREKQVSHYGAKLNQHRSRSYLEKHAAKRQMAVCAFERTA